MSKEFEYNELFVTQLRAAIMSHNVYVTFGKTAQLQYERDSIYEEFYFIHPRTGRRNYVHYKDLRVDLDSEGKPVTLDENDRHMTISTNKGILAFHSYRSGWDLTYGQMLKYLPRVSEHKKFKESIGAISVRDEESDSWVLIGTAVYPENRFDQTPYVEFTDGASLDSEELFELHFFLKTLHV